ncbi:MAG: hypothetical protein AAFP13_04500 [Pseudomonadota bacterium]
MNDVSATSHEELLDLAYELDWHTKRSIIYHKSRQAFFQMLSNGVNFISLLSSSAAAVALLSSPTVLSFEIYATLLIAGAQILGVVGQFSTKATQHARFASAFAGIERTLATKRLISQDLIEDLSAQRISIEDDEPQKFSWLDIICHNEVAISKNQKGEVYQVPWHAYLLRHFLRGRNIDPEKKLIE